MHVTLPSLLFLHLIALPFVTSAPTQFPLLSPIANTTAAAVNTTFVSIPPNNNSNFIKNFTTSPHDDVAHNLYDRLKFQAFYDICLSWRVLAKQQDYFCRRVKLDKAFAAQITRQQAASALLKTTGPLPTTALLALSADQ